MSAGKAQALGFFCSGPDAAAGDIDRLREVVVDCLRELGADHAIGGDLRLMWVSVLEGVELVIGMRPNTLGAEGVEKLVQMLDGRGLRPMVRCEIDDTLARLAAHRHGARRN